MERHAKLRLAYALNQLLAERKSAQAEAARVLGVTQRKVAALRRYKLAGFSVDRLMNLLTVLDQDHRNALRITRSTRMTASTSNPCSSHGLIVAARSLNGGGASCRTWRDHRRKCCTTAYASVLMPAAPNQHNMRTISGP